jgi:RNA polymerase sigma-70 factor (ECF subfamily)
MVVSLPKPDLDGLAVLALRGDQDALGHLLTAHQRSAYNLAYRLLGRDADARDAVQEAFLLALRAIRGDGAAPRESERFGAWLLRIVANAALGQLRRRPRVAALSADDLAEALPAPERIEPARVAERREARGDVLRALLALPDSQRAALTLREFQGYTYHEIAGALGLSRSAVETLLFRARREFRAAYEGLAATTRPVGCPDLSPLLSAMLDGELQASGWLTVSDHLRGCGCCRRELGLLRRSRKLHGLIPLLGLPTGWQPAGVAGAAALSVELAHLPASLGGLAARLGASLGPQLAGPLAASGLGLALLVGSPEPWPPPRPMVAASVVVRASSAPADALPLVEAAAGAPAAAATAPPVAAQPTSRFELAQPVAAPPLVAAVEVSAAADTAPRPLAAADAAERRGEAGAGAPAPEDGAPAKPADESVRPTEAAASSRPGAGAAAAALPDRPLEVPPAGPALRAAVRQPIAPVVTVERRVVATTDGLLEETGALGEKPPAAPAVTSTAEQALDQAAAIPDVAVATADSLTQPAAGVLAAPGIQQSVAPSPAPEASVTPPTPDRAEIRREPPTSDGAVAERAGRTVEKAGDEARATGSRGADKVESTRQAVERKAEEKVEEKVDSTRKEVERKTDAVQETASPAKDAASTAGKSAIRRPGKR